MSTKKKSYRDDLIRFTFLAVALAVFFIGPRYMQSDISDDVDDTMKFVSGSKIPAHVKTHVNAELGRCKQFAQEHTNSVSILSVKMSSVNWLALLIIGLGLGGPLIMKYFDNKRAAASPPQGG